MAIYIALSNPLVWPWQEHKHNQSPNESSNHHCQKAKDNSETGYQNWTPPIIIHIYISLLPLWYLFTNRTFWHFSLIWLITCIEVALEPSTPQRSSSKILHAVYSKTLQVLINLIQKIATKLQNYIDLSNIEAKGKSPLTPHQDIRLLLW